MSIFITDRESVGKFANIDHIISIGSGDPLPDLTAFRHNNFNFHRFYFQDAVRDNEVGITLPNRKMMNRMIGIFYEILSSDREGNVLFHCAAGRSRSPAAAFIFGICAKMSFSDSYRQVLAARGTVQPNMLMIQLADDATYWAGEMFRFVAKASGRPDYKL